ncbi:hypothetical protein B0H19DRAFT_692698 [Mycena capillaripes]|nr:hypothetical protein B0H19DRAFT_692698 [Mycena capillaripes]
MADTSPSIPPFSSDTLSNHALRVRLAEIDAEIMMTKLQARLDHLATARIPVVHALRSIIYPILTLPPEITIEIFLHHVAECPLRLPHSYRDLTGPPLLASICQAWRHIAVNLLQAMWSDIMIYRYAAEPLLECCLARAGSCPLALDLDLKGDNPERLFTAAAKYCMQWETFDASLIFPLAFSMDHVHGRLPRLRKLVLGAYGDLLFTTPPITAFCEAPQLREIDLDGISLRSFSLPWAQLTDLTCREIDATAMMEALGETRGLERLTVHSCDPFSDDPPEPMPLPHLHTLTIPNQDSLDFLDGITLPALKVLTIDSGNEEWLIPLLRLFTRSECRLRVMSMHLPDHSFAMRVCEKMHTISHLHIATKDWNWSWTDELIPFFERLTTDAQFLPNLEMLGMEWDIRAVPHQLVEMLESRRYPRRNYRWKMLEFFTLKCWRDRDEKDDLEGNTDLLDRLHVLVADGLKLELPGFSTSIE